MKVVVTGKGGQLDSCLAEISRHRGIDLVRLGRPDLDLSQPDTLGRVLRAEAPDVLISSAAYTAVDKAESEPDLARTVNGIAPGVLAEIAAAMNIPIIHLSTDYVFSGDKDGPYTETDTPRPQSVYGATKWYGEQGVAAATDNHVILRTAWVYSPFGNNFVKTMLRLGQSRDVVAVVADQYGNPTSALDMADAILNIAQRLHQDNNPALRGVFHLTGSDEATWAGFAVAIFDGARDRGAKAASVQPIPASDYPTAAPRPVNSRLCTDKLCAVYGIRLPNWRDSLDKVLDRLLGEKGKDCL